MARERDERGADAPAEDGGERERPQRRGDVLEARDGVARVETDARRHVRDLEAFLADQAARMETAAPEGGIQISEVMQARLETEFATEYRGEFDMKGKGLQKAWLLKGRR